MPLHIETFRNGIGGNSLYKALTHPLAAERRCALLRSWQRPAGRDLRS